MAEPQTVMSVPWGGARCWPWECTWWRGCVCAWCVSSSAAGGGYRALGTEGSVCGPGYPDIWFTDKCDPGTRTESERAMEGDRERERAKEGERGRERKRERCISEFKSIYTLDYYYWVWRPLMVEKSAKKLHHCEVMTF